MKLHVFYNGTDSNYEKDFKKEGRFMHGEIVSRFGHYAKAEASNENNVLRIHGVGGSKENTNRLSSGVGTGLGLKMREDVTQIVGFVMKARSLLMSKNKDAEVSKQDKVLLVTLMGWSRGGIGCIYAAHMLAKIWDELEKKTPSNIIFDIKIIAFDPVSGLGTNMRALNIDWRDMATLLGSIALAPLDQTMLDTALTNINTAYRAVENWWELPEHVSEYHGFYAHDERSVGFATTIPAMVGKADNRSFNIYSVPGTHSTLVGNLYPYGGSTECKCGRSSVVGLNIYRSVVKKTLQLLSDWGCVFDTSITSDWINPLNAGNEIVTPEALINYKKGAQRALITGNPLSQAKTLGLMTDGRGIYIGGNTQDRKWQPKSTLKEFMSEDNAKSIVDSLVGYVKGSETKLEKLGGVVKVHDFSQVDFNWS